MTRIRILLFVITVIVVGTLATFAAFYARGYRFDIKSFKFLPHGILVIKSNPDGAQVFINGEFETATNATVRLAPGTYDVSLRKDGYLTWEKRLTIEKEVVTAAETQLFRVAPSLSPVTFSEVLSPFPSPDYTRLAYIVPPRKENLGIGKEGLWVMETVNLPLGFTRDPRQVTDGDLTAATWQWSPDGREILLTTRQGVFLLDTGSFTPQDQRVNVVLRKEEILKAWEKEEEQKLTAQIKPLPEAVRDILTRKAKEVVFTPDETKILYVASASAVLDDNLIKPVPGASTQKQERNIKPDHVYVYDVKEDRNFLIDADTGSLTIKNWKRHDKSRVLFWFATSGQLVLTEKEKITIMDFDGTNRQPVYSGSYLAPYAFPTQNLDRLLILTNLGADSTLANLYSISLK